ncbi:hypothetical protein CDD82_3640 [Ophiocordyceps australis]|uniref:Beta-catenin-like protein 1 N-terminal domain-containing protein n=1 Tax=Ophiocordyceps australis TaxID=1399860 RepID=A0A2C5ZCK9_9HYPO|nr:hypothetical protein CDD82_3640 [Ophiocordyceps australis]
MASVDDIFKSAGVSNTKRKIETVRDPNEIYKATKLAANSSSRDSALKRPDDAPGPDEADDDAEAGPTLPPGFDDGLGADDDDDDQEGRFFGGGISKQESQILDYVDRAEAEAPAVPDKIDASWLRKTTQNLERRITTNAELRAKYAHDPHKFIASEAQLDADIHALALLAEHPHLYPDLATVGLATSLAGLLAHDNTDIAIAAVQVLAELTDDDVEAQQDDWAALVDSLVNHGQLVSLLVSNLNRLDDLGADETDRAGVYHILNLVENLCSRPATAAHVAVNDDLVGWLLARIRRNDSSTTATVSQNRQYAAEILAILAQASAETRKHIASRPDDDALDILLQLVAPYRRRDADHGDEAEYVENLFEALTCLVDDGTAGKPRFLDAEGVELCLLMLSQGKKSRGPALRLLDHAASASMTSHVSPSTDICLRIVAAGGLKTLFTLFAKTHDRTLLSHLLALFASMLRLLPADSPERIRTLAKFVEKDYAKTARLVVLRADWAARVRQAEQAYRRDLADDADEAEVELELLARRLDAGLHTLQQIDLALAWLVAEDGGARSKIQALLAERNEGLAAIASTIEAQRQALDTSEEDGKDVNEMLATLLDFVR